MNSKFPAHINQRTTPEIQSNLISIRLPFEIFMIPKRFVNFITSFLDFFFLYHSPNSTGADCFIVYYLSLCHFTDVFKDSPSQRNILEMENLHARRLTAKSRVLRATENRGIIRFNSGFLGARYIMLIFCALLEFFRN